MYFFSSLFASQRRKKVPKKEEKTQLFSTSSLCSAVFHFRLRRIFLKELVLPIKVTAERSEDVEALRVFCPLLWVHFKNKTSKLKTHQNI